MALSNELISELVKVTNDRDRDRNDYVVYGTIADDGARKYVQLDGSDLSTPIITTTDINNGDRVIVQVKNHTATVTGNIDDPAVGTKRAGNIESKITHTAEEIRSEVTNVESGLKTLISQTDTQIRAHVADEVKGLNSTITQTASEIRAEVKSTTDGLSSRITQTAKEIRSELADEVKGLNSTITQTASEIRAEVKSTTDGLSSRITQNADKITTVVQDQDEFSTFQQTVEGFAFMNKGGTVKISGGSINLTGAITFSDLSDDVTDEIDAANTNASNAVNTANGASSTANTALNKANSASTKADSASSLATEASKTANSAILQASSAEEIAKEAKSIAESMDLPDYLKSTYIDSTTIMSPSIIGGQFYAVSEDAYLEINSDGLAAYVDDTSYPKFEIQNHDTYVQLILGSGNTGGNNKGRFIIQKDTDGTSLVYVTPNGNDCGFRFNSDGTIDILGTLIT